MSSKQKQQTAKPRITLTLGKKITINNKNEYEIKFDVCTCTANGNSEANIGFILQDQSLNTLTTNVKPLQTDGTGHAQGVITIPVANNASDVITVTASRNDMPQEKVIKQSEALPLPHHDNVWERAKFRWQNQERRRNIIIHGMQRFLMCLILALAISLFGTAIKIGIVFLCFLVALKNEEETSPVILVFILICAFGLWMPNVIDGAFIYAALIACVLIPISFAAEELLAKRQKIESEGKLVDEYIYNPHPKVILTITFLLTVFYVLCLVKVIFTGYEWSYNPNATIDLDVINNNQVDVIALVMGEPQPSQNIFFMLWDKTYGFITWPFRLFTQIIPPVSTLDGCVRGVLQYLLLFLMIIILEMPQEFMSLWRGNQIIKEGVKTTGEVKNKFAIENLFFVSEAIDMLMTAWNWLKKNWAK